MAHDLVDEWLFGWDTTPGIVSVWADREGRALVWRRIDGQVVLERVRYRPWLFANQLDDLTHLGTSLQPEGTAGRTPFRYAEFEGPPGSLRFLISAASGRALERALLSGASRRLGRTITSLYDLPGYYRVGPVEQYLMQSGRVYFRGLAYDDLHRMQIDLETTALDPARGRIFMAAVRDSRGLALTLEAPTPEDERVLLQQLLALVHKHDPDIIENHNLFGFDLPFLEARAAALGLTLGLGRPGGPTRLEHIAEPFAAEEAPGRRQRRYTVAGRELIDTLDAVRRHDFVARDLPSYRLKEVARTFGIAAPDRVYFAGEAIVGAYKSDPAAVRRYALDDVAEVDALSQRLMRPVFALAGMAPRRYERLASAGPAMGILEPLLVRVYLRHRVALPGPGEAPTAEGQHAGGAVFLFATGVAERVVKADIASLYPSLMRTYTIGPASDRLGALLALVDRLTTLRLEHKAAARAYPRASLEAGYHDATQAAMKLIINAAYGYMGAGAMALFADRHAADEVTRRGREVLGEVLNELRTRGVALIEADTDGVYFAVPPGWDEARERAVVAEVAATLPAGIRLEYEGRYRAMLSHEVKNYALLTYSGDLIVRGVALRSSRAEPYGERFLRRALRCVMQGDIAGVRQAFVETALALRARELPAADLATRVRLSKSPTDYAASRQRMREAAYEALLAAGRNDWRVGERVRCYRTGDGAFVWLPDETVDDGRWTVNQEQSTEPGTISPHDRPPSTACPERSRRVHRPSANERRDYDVEHYLRLLVGSYASRLRKAFRSEDFDQLFRLDAQLGLFDRPIEEIEPIWIRGES